MRIGHALDGRAVLRLGTAQIRLTHLATGAALIATVLLLAIWSLFTGVTRISGADLSQLWQGAASADSRFALLEVRLPRIVTGFMAGWCVAVTGAMLQSLARNPLADPGLLGLSQGSMVMILLLIVFAPGISTAVVPFAAMAGGLVVAMILLALSGRRTGGFALLMMGIAVETVLSSLTQILILYTPSETSYALSDWLAGSLSGADRAAMWALSPWFLLSIPAALLAGRRLSAFDLGEETAQSLGENVHRSRPLILFLSVMLTAAAVTAAGPLVFLGVMAPHLTGFLSLASGTPRLILSGLAGGALVLAADLLTRSFSADIALPLGLSLTLVGVPLFVISMRLRALKLSRN